MVVSVETKKALTDVFKVQEHLPGHLFDRKQILIAKAIL